MFHWVVTFVELIPISLLNGKWKVCPEPGDGEDSEQEEYPHLYLHKHQEFNKTWLLAKHGLSSFSSYEPERRREACLITGAFIPGAQRVHDQHGWILIRICGAYTLFSQGEDF